MRAITKWRLLGMFATAKGDFLLFFKMNFFRRKVRAGMRSIAKGLLFRSSTATPIDRSRANLHHVGCLLRNFNFIGHNNPLLPHSSFGNGENVSNGILPFMLHIVREAHGRPPGSAKDNRQYHPLLILRYIQDGPTERSPYKY